MEKANVLNLFKVGELAEMRTFEEGFRSAWFRCKIIDVMSNENKIKLEYPDFEQEEINWVMIYEVPPYARRSRSRSRSTPIEKELMLRPKFPPVYHKSEMPPVNSISQECVLIDGTWMVGDLVEWFKDDCYWSAKVIKVLSDDKVQVELPMYPVGERKKEEDIHIASVTDLRPWLDWSETKGWTLPTTAVNILNWSGKRVGNGHGDTPVRPHTSESKTRPHWDGQTSCRAELIFPSKQDVLDMDLEVENAPAGSPLNASSTTRISADRDTKRQSSDPVDTPICNEPVQSSDPVDSVIREKPVQSDDDVKMDDDFVESSNSISSLRVKKSKAADEEDKVDIDHNSRMELNIKREDTLEAAILDLEELVNKVKWIKTILHSGQSPSNHAPSWKFT